LQYNKLAAPYDLTFSFIVIQAIRPSALPIAQLTKRWLVWFFDTLKVHGSSFYYSCQKGKHFLLD
jgi:hypothetical protein